MNHELMDNLHPHRQLLYVIHRQEYFAVLSHHHLDLVLDLGAHVGGDVVGQLIGGALEAVHHLLELADQGVACLLLPLFAVLHVSLQLLDVCDQKETKETTQESMPVESRQINRVMSGTKLK